MVPTATYFQGIVTGMYVMACLVIAAVRWFHMCRPCDRNPEYYYPGRRAVTIIYLSALFLLPYIFFPESDGAWLLVKAYFLPMDLYFLTILLFSYFGNVMHWRKWRRPTLILGGIALLALFAGPAMALLDVGEGRYDSVRIGQIIIFSLGLFMTGVCLFAVRTVLRWTARIDVEEYSNPEDYPVNFARKMVRLLLVTVALLWVAALSDSRAVMAVLQLLLVGASVLMLISALHPHRHGMPEEEQPAPEGSASQVYSYKLSPAKAKSIAAAIRQVVEEQQAFLDPHLTLQDVATRCGYNRTYVTGILKSEFGGFFHYVNSLRLQHADEYRAAHPSATIAEIAEASGFGTRASYYKIKKTLEESASVLPRVV